MKIEMHEVPLATIEEFADEHGLVMEVRERGKDAQPPARYYAAFKRADVKQGSCLVGNYGDGPTPEDAIASYAMRISEETLVIGAYTPDRREIRVPRLVSAQARALRHPKNN